MSILAPRDVPLGGLRAMTVRRTLPSRARTTIGAWCFVDHYGPDRVAETGGMIVAPHPHTGLQTVSWLFEGEIEHRDSAGHQALVRPGEVNLMTAGRGIVHSEYSTSSTDTLHGAQLWVVLPEEARAVEPAFEHYAPEPISGEGWSALVFLGELLGSPRSPVRTHTPLVGAELSLAPATRLEIEVPDDHEWGVLVDRGIVSVNGTEAKPGDLATVEPGKELSLEAHDETRLLVLGGPPFGEPIVMWWNFIGRTHDEVVRFREEWQALVESREQRRFSLPEADPHDPIPAPALPRGVRLRTR